MLSHGGFGFQPFSPEKKDAELFAYLRKSQSFFVQNISQGITQLEEEGAIQVLHAAGGGKQELILAAVGQLQFDVVQFRLNSEYGVETRLEMLSHRIARWVTEGHDALKKRRPELEILTLIVQDRWFRPVLLFKSEWHLQKVEQ